MVSTALPVLSDAPQRPARRVGRLESYSLRVSLLEQCQYSCPYCMPGAVNPYSRRGDWLTADHYRMLAPLFGARGVSKVRFTGGEPMLREDVVDVVAAWREALPGVDLALTTNGQRLRPHLAGLKAAGLNRLNVHIDTLRDARYPELMGKGARPADILDVIADAAGAFDEVKVNAVVQRGKNDDELLDFLAWSETSGVEVRFIELMNTGSARDYVSQTFFTGQEMVERVAAARRVRRIDRREASDPAALFIVDDKLSFGVIASDTEPFCADCNRLRLTATGKVRGCLYESGGVALRPALDAGDTGALAELIDRAQGDKRSFHPTVDTERVPFSMADVGG